jgi:tetratricopeptide (TPR) repeat protein
MLNSLGATLHRLRRWDEARTALTEGARESAACGERQLQAHALATLGDVCLASGRLDEAQASVEASLALRRELSDRRGEGWMLERLARILVARDLREAAARAAEESAAIAGELDDDALRDVLARLDLPATSTNPPSR